MAALDVVRVGEHSTRAELIEALGNLNHRAQREFPVVEKLTTDEPTAWTCRHRAINETLDALEQAET